MSNVSSPRDKRDNISPKSSVSVNKRPDDPNRGNSEARDAGTTAQVVDVPVSRSSSKPKGNGSGSKAPVGNPGQAAVSPKPSSSGTGEGAESSQSDNPAAKPKRVLTEAQILAKKKRNKRRRQNKAAKKKMSMPQKSSDEASQPTEVAPGAQTKKTKSKKNKNKQSQTENQVESGEKKSQKPQVNTETKIIKEDRESPSQSNQNGKDPKTVKEISESKSPKNKTSTLTHNRFRSWDRELFCYELSPAAKRSLEGAFGVTISFTQHPTIHPHAYHAALRRMVTKYLVYVCCQNLKVGYFENKDKWEAPEAPWKKSNAKIVDISGAPHRHSGDGVLCTLFKYDPIDFGREHRSDVPKSWQFDGKADNLEFDPEYWMSIDTVYHHPVDELVALVHRSKAYFAGAWDFQYRTDGDTDCTYELIWNKEGRHVRMNIRGGGNYRHPFPSFLNEDVITGSDGRQIIRETFREFQFGMKTPFIIHRFTPCKYVIPTVEEAKLKLSQTIEVKSVVDLETMHITEEESILSVAGYATNVHYRTDGKLESNYFVNRSVFRQLKSYVYGSPREMVQYQELAGRARQAYNAVDQDGKMYTPEDILFTAALAFKITADFDATQMEKALSHQGVERVNALHRDVNFRWVDPSVVMMSVTFMCVIQLIAWVFPLMDILLGDLLYLVTLVRWIALLPIVVPSLQGVMTLICLTRTVYSPLPLSFHTSPLSYVLLTSAMLWLLSGLVFALQSILLLMLGIQFAGSIELYGLYFIRVSVVSLLMPGTRDIVWQSVRRMRGLSNRSVFNPENLQMGPWLPSLKLNVSVNSLLTPLMYMILTLLILNLVSLPAQVAATNALPPPLCGHGQSSWQQSGTVPDQCVDPNTGKWQATSSTPLVEQENMLVGNWINGLKNWYQQTMKSEYTLKPISVRMTALKRNLHYLMSNVSLHNTLTSPGTSMFGTQISSQCLDELEVDGQKAENCESRVTNSLVELLKGVRAVVTRAAETVSTQEHMSHQFLFHFVNIDGVRLYLATTMSQLQLFLNLRLVNLRLPFFREQTHWVSKLNLLSLNPSVTLLSAVEPFGLQKKVQSLGRYLEECYASMAGPTDTLSTLRKQLGKWMDGQSLREPMHLECNICRTMYPSYLSIVNRSSALFQKYGWTRSNLTGQAWNGNMTWIQREFLSFLNVTIYQLPNMKPSQHILGVSNKFLLRFPHQHWSKFIWSIATSLAGQPESSNLYPSIKMPSITQLQAEWKAQGFSAKKIAKLTRRHDGKMPIQKKNSFQKSKFKMEHSAEIVFDVIQDNGQVQMSKVLDAKIVPRLTRMARNYDKYRLANVDFQWIPSIGSLTGGNVAMYLEKDLTTTDLPTSVQEVMAQANAVMALARQNKHMSVSTGGWRFTKDQPQPSASAYGILDFVAEVPLSEVSQGDRLGYVKIKYDYEFDIPSVESDMIVLSDTQITPFVHQDGASGNYGGQMYFNIPDLNKDSAVITFVKANPNDQMDFIFNSGNVTDAIQAYFPGAVGANGPENGLSWLTGNSFAVAKWIPGVSNVIDQAKKTYAVFKNEAEAALRKGGLTLADKVTAAVGQATCGEITDLTSAAAAGFKDGCSTEPTNESWETVVPDGYIPLPAMGRSSDGRILLSYDPAISSTTVISGAIAYVNGRSFAVKDFSVGYAGYGMIQGSATADVLAPVNTSVPTSAYPSGWTGLLYLPPSYGVSNTHSLKTAGASFLEWSTKGYNYTGTAWRLQVNAVLLSNSIVKIISTENAVTVNGSDPTGQLFTLYNVAGDSWNFVPIGSTTAYDFNADPGTVDILFVRV